MKSILKKVSDKTLAHIARVVLSKKGRIILDEETIGFLYQNGKNQLDLIVIDSDGDFMRVPRKTARKGQRVYTPESLQATHPHILRRIDPKSAKRLNDAAKNQ